jgi:hypothetical protein
MTGDVCFRGRPGTSRRFSLRLVAKPGSVLNGPADMARRKELG